jgi:hypothetical protein
VTCRRPHSASRSKRWPRRDAHRRQPAASNMAAVSVS